jgi:hypothetical protein
VAVAGRKERGGDLESHGSAETASSERRAR